MGDVRQGIWSDKIGNSLLVEYETRKVVMTELEIMPLNCPNSRSVKSLRIVEDFFRICPAFGQNKIEYPKQRKISDTYYHINYIGDAVISNGISHRTIPVSSSTIYPHQSLNFLMFLKYILYVVPS